MKGGGQTEDVEMSCYKLVTGLEHVGRPSLNGGSTIQISAAQSISFLGSASLRHHLEDA
jgi:hypothetical protein